jgi:hypothetical protein
VGLLPFGDFLPGVLLVLVTAVPQVEKKKSKNKERSREWWCTPAIPALRSQRQENQEFQVSLGYAVRSGVGVGEKEGKEREKKRKEGKREEGRKGGREGSRLCSAPS